MDAGAVVVPSLATSGLMVRLAILILLALYWAIDAPPLVLDGRSVISPFLFTALLAPILIYELWRKSDALKRYSASFFIGSDQFIRALAMWHVVERSGLNAAGNVLILNILLIGNQLALISNFNFNQLAYSGKASISNKRKVLHLQAINLQVISAAMLVVSFLMVVLGGYPFRIIFDYGLIAVGLGLNVILGPVPLLMKNQGQEKIVVLVNCVAILIIVSTVAILEILNQALMFQALAFLCLNASRCAALAIFYHRQSYGEGGDQADI